MNYADPSGLMGERKGGDGPGDGKKPDPNKIYGPKGGVLIEEVIIKGKKKSNAAHAFMQMSLDLDKGLHDGAMDYTKDAYNFATKNAYSKTYWQEKGGETLMGAAFISDINKIRPDGSTNGMDLFNSVSEASAYDVGHFVGYNNAQFVTTAALTEGIGMMRIGLYPKLLRGSGGKVNGFSIGTKPGYGAQPRFDVHPLKHASKPTRRLTIPKWLKNSNGEATLPHYHRGKGNNLKYHRPWEKGPDGKRRW